MRLLYKKITHNKKREKEEKIMMKYLQKLGKALMLPVATLPICGILMSCNNARWGHHRLC